MFMGKLTEAIVILHRYAHKRVRRITSRRPRAIRYELDGKPYTAAQIIDLSDSIRPDRCRYAG